MLTLLLLRHAKAEAAGRCDDFDRALTEKGERDAGAVGDFLLAHRLKPDVALVSTAARTVRTFELVAARTGSVAAVHREDGLYNAHEGRIIDRLGRIGCEARVVLIVGHNPGIMDVATALAREGDLGDIERLRSRFPPCGLAVLGFHAEDWSSSRVSGGRLDAIVFPEDLVSGE